MKRCVLDLVGVEPVNGDVERVGSEAGAMEKPQRQGDAERLVSQFVAGDEEDGACGAQVHGRPPEQFIHLLYTERRDVTRFFTTTR